MKGRCSKMDRPDISSRNAKLAAMMLSLASPEGWERSEAMTRDSIAAFSQSERLNQVQHVVLIGQGTSLATAMNAEFLFSSIVGIDALAIPAFPFRCYCKQYLPDPSKTLVVGISCSGNTASVVLGLQKAKEAGALTMCISGNGDIGAAAWSDYRIRAYTEIERENQTSAYSASHLFLLYGAFQAAVYMSSQRSGKSVQGQSYWDSQWQDLKQALRGLPALFDRMNSIAHTYVNNGWHNIVVLATGPNGGTAQEGALKICEMAWLFGASEELEDFAHGRFRGVDGNIPLFILSPHKNTQPKVLDLLAGCHIAKTPALIFTEETCPELTELAEDVVLMPSVKEECLTPFLYVFPLWFFGYHIRAHEGNLVGERRFGLLATDIDYSAYKARKQ